ncbi:MAG: hypothetical protein U5O12_18710 [Rhodoferax sp.]|nr:hypothetical protein [Rhodoferax sp.]MDZ7921988.1 hypothetical protein [Rhodoferax sp.]
MTKLSITECAPTTMRVPRTESSMSAIGETRALWAIWIVMSVPQEPDFRDRDSKLPAPSPRCRSSCVGHLARRRFQGRIST